MPLSIATSTLLMLAVFSVGALHTDAHNQSNNRCSQFVATLYSTNEMFCDIPRASSQLEQSGTFGRSSGARYSQYRLTRPNSLTSSPSHFLSQTSEPRTWSGSPEVQPALCAVLIMTAEQKVREAGLFDKGALPPVLRACALMTWLYCGAFYGQLYMVSNTYQHGAIDVIGGTCGAVVLIKLSGITSERLPTVTRPLAWIGRDTLPLFCMHLAVLNVAPVERALHPARCVCGADLAHHAGGSCRVLGRVDGDVVCAAENCGQVVLCGNEG